MDKHSSLSRNEHKSILQVWIPGLGRWRNPKTVTALCLSHHGTCQDAILFRISSAAEENRGLSLSGRDCDFNLVVAHTFPPGLQPSSPHPLFFRLLRTSVLPSSDPEGIAKATARWTNKCKTIGSMPRRKPGRRPAVEDQVSSIQAQPVFHYGSPSRSHHADEAQDAVGRDEWKCGSKKSWPVHSTPGR